MNDFPLLLSAEKSQTKILTRADLSELEKIGIKSFNLGILRTRVWTVKEIGLANLSSIIPSHIEVVE